MSMLKTMLWIGVLTFSSPGLAAVFDWCGPKLTNPFFYELRRGDRVSFALGTMHHGVSARLLPQSVLDVIYGGTDFVFELPPADAASVLVGWRTWRATHSLVPGRLRLKLSREHWAKLIARLTENGVPSARALTLTPAGALMLIDRSMRERQKAMGASQMDHELKFIFAYAGAPIHSFETFDDQLGLLARLSTLERLRADLDAPPDPNEIPFSTSIANYISGDEADNLREMAALETIDPEAYASMITDRNRRWLPDLIERHGRPGRHVFFAGVAHWLGREGLLELLSNEGFEITRRQ